jgi:hypothetical protein
MLNAIRTNKAGEIDCALPFEDEAAVAHADDISRPFHWIAETAWAVGQNPLVGDVWNGDSPATFTRPAAVIEVPDEVSMAQARLALLAAGLLQTVEAAVSSLPTAAQIEWDYRATVHRESALVLQLGGALGLTPKQIDALFVAALQY